MKKSVMNQTENKKSELITVNNPIIWSDVPDPDIIRIGECYYMVSTTMFYTPGVPIMKSTDLVSWEIVSYVYDILEDNDTCNLQNGKNAYGIGSWAASLRYNNGIFYVCFMSYDQGKTYIYQTTDIENGTWKRSEFVGIYHDASLLFDDDGRVYLIHGNGTIRIKELNADATAFKPGGIDQVLIETDQSNNIVSAEGSHFYKIDGKYYVLLIQWPKTGTSRRIELCYRSDSLLGIYESKVVMDDNLNYGNSGVAQGGIVSTPEEEWYALLFQDHGAVGRMPVLLPVTWEDGWPMMGVSGKAPATITIPTDKKQVGTILAQSDEFNYADNSLNLNWQWNHNPDNDNWSVTEREGYLRLTTGSLATTIFDARNSLTLRTEGPTCTSEVAIDVSGMKPGDYAGISAFQDAFGIVGVRMDKAGNKYIFMAVNGGKGVLDEKENAQLLGDTIYLKIDYVFGKVSSTGRVSQVDNASFYYSTDGDNWLPIGTKLSMSYKLTLFTGYRTALFNYATTETGGHVDFDYLHYARTEW